MKPSQRSKRNNEDKATTEKMEPEEQVEYKIQRLNLLAFPRDANPICELTGARASVELVTQYLTL
jgi:hypothetical protein